MKKYFIAVAALALLAACSGKKTAEPALIEEDVYAINYALCSGCKGIFTAHGANMEELRRNPILSQLLTKQMIDRILFLDNNRKIQLGYSKQTAKQVV